MNLFRAYLVVLVIALGTYTGIVIAHHGWGLLAIFLNDIAAMTWPGQFNADFTTFLSLSALWTAWRHGFSPAGLALGVVAFFGGMMFLAPYLLIASLQARGDIKILLLGPARANA